MLSRSKVGIVVPSISVPLLNLDLQTSILFEWVRVRLGIPPLWLLIPLHIHFAALDIVDLHKTNAVTVNPVLRV